MDIKVGIDLECTILSDDQLVESDDGKSTPQTVNDIVNNLIWRIEFVVWADDLCQCVNREILFVVQNEICQEQVPEPASYVFFYALFNLRNLLYLIPRPISTVFWNWTRNRRKRMNDRKKRRSSVELPAPFYKIALDYFLSNV